MNKQSYLLMGIGILTAVGMVAMVKFSKKVENELIPTAQGEWINSPNIKNAKDQIEKSKAIDEAIVCLKNESNALPLNNLMAPTRMVTIGGNSESLVEGFHLFFNPKIETYHSPTQSINVQNEKSSRIIVSLHADTNTSLKISDWVWKSLPDVSQYDQAILLVFGDCSGLDSGIIQSFDAVLWMPENHPEMQRSAAQKVVGVIPIIGKLTQNVAGLKKGFGISIAANGRLHFGIPEELGLNSKLFDKIDEIALSGITSSAYPGCQVVVAVKGKIIYRKCFGKYTYDADALPVNHESMYDIASITKIASSTLTTMILHHEGKIDLHQPLGFYIPEITSNSAYQHIIIREMMAHQAGLEPFIPFYKRTLSDGAPALPYYNTLYDATHQVEVADNLYLQTAYKDSMYARILRNPLKEKKYLYSDLCYYFMQPILEKLTGMPLDRYVQQRIYQPLGLRFIGYKPLQRFSKDQIVPTERDQYFRKQLLWGYVHDPGAAMLGGVAGHAGLFSNATDLAQIMQLFLNGGKMAGHQFFDERTVNEFTRAQFPGNKRGIGFDRPNASGGGTCDELASQKSFGHSGFTGTLAWADPKNEVVFVFLSNRVHPSQDNWKIRDMNIRTKIQHVVYEIVNARYGN